MADWKKLLQQAHEKRKPLFEVTDAYRVVNGAADGFPGLTLDRFGSRFQIQYFGPELLRQKNAIVAAIGDLLAPDCLVVKERLSSSGRSLENPPMEVLIGDPAGSVGTVFEGPAKFNVDLLDTINPGLFLDMRSIRLEVGTRCEGRRFLNLFSYTCSFSVHARLGGAAIATNADISGKILDKGRANFALNGLDLRPGEFFKGNAVEYVHWAQKKGLKFDGIVLDPPSFARFKGTNFNVREHLMPLVSDCATLLNQGGFFMVSSNYSEFELNSFARSVRDAVGAVHPHAKTSWKKSQDIDFVASGSSKDSCLVATLVEV
ncbi:class I SAM-dependent rRNA methyltransferase [Fibrobacter sp. UWEL]|uniref:class I SAM-dependent rRNA methyltransferase n=1 Tax=Fibrobacter sp. UWEL TaxID=1896209 RepID=UPI000921FCDE|nr:class I SAM-dependent methyltransferase [Fibrobacter sp. UWEL]SHK57440.1 23S rRNA G2069 N7-methylase RlmK or C1962 C5-methylase RlmI [Fibrobacter sp. UWEL]